MLSFCFRKTGKSHGENIWQGYKYKLPIDNPKLQGFILDSNGLYQIIIAKEKPQLIDPLGKTEEILESEFYQPVGKKLVMKMENTGTLLNVPCDCNYEKIR